MKTILVVLGITALFTACQNNHNATSVQDLNKQFIAAWNNRDTAKIDSFLATDVQFLQADKHFNGKTEVVNRWVRETVPTIANLRTNAVSSNSDDHSAYEGGTFAVDLAGAPGQPQVTGQGNYVFLWKRQPDDTWKISYIQLEDLPIGVAAR